jgi:hypothetical protein
MTINEAAHVTGAGRPECVSTPAWPPFVPDKGEELLAATAQRSTHAQMMETR